MAFKFRWCKHCKKVTQWYEDEREKHCTVCFND